MKAYKFKLKTNKKFECEATRTLAICRELYNASIQERRDAWQINHVSCTYRTQQNQLPEIKQIRLDFKEVHSQVLQDVLQRSDKAFDNFFRRVKEGAEEPGFPRFKGADRYDSFTYSQSGFRLEGDKLHLSKIGSVRVRLSREIAGKIKTCTIKRECDGWYVIFTAEVESAPLPKTGETVGIDVGIENFATLSTGAVIENPQFFRQAESELKTAQRRVARRANKRSKRRRKAVRLLQRKHQKVERQRQDFQHKTARQIVNDFDVIAVEQLNVKGLVKNRHLAKSISDVAWASFILILTYKAAEAGREVVKVNPAYTSQDCARCGNRVRKTLATREHRCSNCGFVAHRDYNAALNIIGRADLSGMARESRELSIPHYHAALGV